MYEYKSKNKLELAKAWYISTYDDSNDEMWLITRGKNSLTMNYMQIKAIRIPKDQRRHSHDNLKTLEKAYFMKWSV